MKLSELLDGYDHEVIQGDTGTEIGGGVAYDSRKVTEGALFVAVRGFSVDGHRFVTQAAARGAAAVLVDHEVEDVPEDVCVVRVADTRAASPVVASRYFGEPGRAMDMVAITGTNGKTSVAFMLEAVLRQSAKATVGVIGTAGNRIGEEPIALEKTTPTTPEAIDLQYLLGHMRDRGASAVVLEASSMALHLHRVDHCFVDVGVFTNFSQDHLDDHGTMENYKNAKLTLFKGLCRRAVVNSDDPVSAEIAALMPGAVTTFALEDAEADFHGDDLVVDAAGTRFTLRHEGRALPVTIPMPGRFAALNALATLAICHSLGHSLEDAVAALAELPPTPGRFESYRTPAGVPVIVDYAHSPDALDNVLSTIRDFTTGRVITVFGCGGDRDATKRAPMGEIAGRYSDLCVLTSDNPRSEDPEKILDDIVPGITATGTPFERISDRREAIRAALLAAREGDTVLVAGKGSENYQILADRTIHFEDMETVRELSEELAAR
ncbi:UDP-N-acetylmuramoyl-L-alanyl-D-glutamate--2,6-diaminopimelate ligase [Streptomyces sp. A012304]|uniref:UDP-N-acetylmuramoyl-L-alanyl-D-glutamate--2, 6-diaminopimelate ligase n=1 Tax=Streptomyces sp. A012304 TaxID=375446 RepID=UPI00222F221D|nr:UDP-N-acetylmuramoyl-L-alanyl-D-glutamate--2,6-diaminopimelate ligase [Streptomyces sp. A012304]GKQ39570.1 UDP-N-acetylmuramoyl-L-alanyl-D-glutamate--2,6-diaminopimelate ligase 2 [Streptomyces sp. A012304]